MNTVQTPLDVAEVGSWRISEAEAALIREFCGQDPRRVALKLKKTADVRPNVVAEQVDGMNRLKVKVPSWHSVRGLLFPFPVAIQQCSSEEVARWRSSLVVGDSLVDLTGGLGVDCFFMGQGVASVTYVDADVRAVEAARHNFALLGKTGVDFVCSTAEDYVETLAASGQKVGTLFVDPSRRTSSGGRLFRVADCSPDVSLLADKMLAVADVVLVKLSPLLDVSSLLAQLACVSDVYAVGCAGECKDLVVRMSSQKTVSQPTMHAVYIDGGGDEFVFAQDDEKAAVADFATPQPGWHLFEPNPTLMKMGPFRLIGKRFGACAISASSHLYVAAADIPSFPGRRFCVDAVYDGGRKGRGKLQGDTSRASVAVRGFPMSAEALRKLLRLKDGGDAYVFGVTAADGALRLVLCHRVG